MPPFLHPRLAAVFFPVRYKVLEVDLVGVGHVEHAKQGVVDGGIAKRGALARLVTAYVAASSLAAARLPHERNHVRRGLVLEIKKNSSSVSNLQHLCRYCNGVPLACVACV